MASRRKQSDEDYRRFLIEALKNPDEMVRAAAAMKIGWLAPPMVEAIGALIELLDDPRFGNRQHATAALGHMGEAAEVVVPALARRLGVDDNEFVRGEICRALGEIGTEAAVTTLIPALKDSD